MKCCNHSILFPILYPGLWKQFKCIHKGDLVLLNIGDNSVPTLALMKRICLLNPESTETGSVTLITVQQQVDSLSSQQYPLAHKVYKQNHSDTHRRGF